VPPAPPTPADADADAGDFAAWRARLLAGLEDGTGSDVPCGDCTACCTSGYFVHVEPDEVEALRRIPKALQFPAPGRPKGHVVLPYDERGHCPMFVDGACSIYEHRPRTCRDYDCRVFAATGVAPDDDKPDIVARVRRWRFTYASDDDRRLQEAVPRAVDALAADPAHRTAARSDLALLALRHPDPAAPGDH
jgi:Fe-S-cluster containining protein